MKTITLKWEYAAAIAIALLLIGMMLSSRTKIIERNNASSEKQLVRTRIDTAYQTVYVPIVAARARIHSNREPKHIGSSTTYRLDTVMRFDTSARDPDTLSLMHTLPADSFAISLRFSPRRANVQVPYIAHDTFYWHSDTIRTSQETKRAWYDETLSVVLAVAGGFVLGRALR